MSQSHTPAPWRNGWGKIVDSEGKAICMLTYRKNGYNGDLIAAAPELLAALQMATHCLAWHEEQHGVGVDAEALRVARAAIAKATGVTA